MLPPPQTGGRAVGVFRQIMKLKKEVSEKEKPNEPGTERTRKPR
jgi:hypothetical protein